MHRHCSAQYLAAVVVVVVVVVLAVIKVRHATHYYLGQIILRIAGDEVIIEGTECDNISENG